MSQIKMQLKHILVAHQYEIDDLLEKLKEGDAFSELAKKFSKCPSASLGGDLGLIDLSRLDPDFAEEAEKLKIGEISKAVKTRFGYHLIQRL